jgi:alkanesulfonate monooxygenase SsuD/methylene tetrahydromethanopterin reductase-like flavin-dependent oxidoreductase (luciferase family)
MADGTTLAWVGPKTVRTHIVPRISDAAAAAGRPAPRIIATLPVCVTADPERVRARISESLSLYGQLPSYKAMFEREGAAGPAEVAIVGSEAEVRERIDAMADAGVTDFAVSEFALNGDERRATRELLCSMTGQQT